MKLIDIIAKLERTLTGLKCYKERESRDFSNEIELIRNRIGNTLDSMVSAEDEISCAKANFEYISYALDELEDMLKDH